MLFKTLLTLSACAAASLTLFRTHQLLRSARRVPIGIRASSAETGLFV